MATEKRPIGPPEEPSLIKFVTRKQIATGCRVFCDTFDRLVDEEEVQDFVYQDPIEWVGLNQEEKDVVRRAMEAALLAMSAPGTIRLEEDE